MANEWESWDSNPGPSDSSHSELLEMPSPSPRLAGGFDEMLDVHLLFHVSIPYPWPCGLLLSPLVLCQGALLWRASVVVSTPLKPPTSICAEYVLAILLPPDSGKWT